MIYDWSYYCETIAAYKWHIRPLTAKGKKLSGGANTLALCGAEAKWDVRHEAPQTTDDVRGICGKCLALFNELQRGNAGT